MNMQITVFGASGRVGQQVVNMALAGGYDVVASVHSHNPFEGHNRLKVISGDVNDPKAVKDALDGSQAVISALGSWGTKDKNVLSQGMKAIIPAMESADIKRLITLTGSGAIWSGDKPNFIDKSSHVFIALAARKILLDSEDHFRQLDASSLDWTCIRSPIMSSGPARGYKLNFKAPSVIERVPREDVVKAIIDQLSDEQFIRSSPHIHKA